MEAPDSLMPEHLNFLRAKLETAVLAELRNAGSVKSVLFTLRDQGKLQTAIIVPVYGRTPYNFF